MVGLQNQIILIFVLLKRPSQVTALKSGLKNKSFVLFSIMADVVERRKRLEEPLAQNCLFLVANFFVLPSVSCDSIVV